MTTSGVPLGGIHHVTAIATDPRRNVAFYREVLGLRLVKRTVNFDDPRTYHLYFGDTDGAPGSILTFFPWPHARRGSRGVGQAICVGLRVPPRSLGFWYQRLRGLGLVASTPDERFGERRLTFLDPDGLKLRLMESPGAEKRPFWQAGGIEAGFAVRSIYGVALLVESHAPTETLLGDTLGFVRLASDGDEHRWQIGDGDDRAMVDIIEDPMGEYGSIAAGTIHHVAWRARDETVQRAWRERLRGSGLEVTAVLDRNYFKSIYFREPGGTLFEIATDSPGFAIDELRQVLGTSLKLPPGLESQRREIEAGLPPLDD